MFKVIAMRGLLVAAVAFSVLVSSIPAHAGLDFAFSFTNTFGLVNGTVTGEIDGLTDNATSAATDLIITGYPVGLALPGTPWDIFNAAGFVVGGNSFTVTGEHVTAALFIEASLGNSTSLTLNDSGVNGLQDATGNDVLDIDGFTGITFTQIPEPASGALVLGDCSAGACVVGLPVAQGL